MQRASHPWRHSVGNLVLMLHKPREPLEHLQNWLQQRVEYEDVDGETLRSLLGGSENHRVDFGVLARKLIRAVNRTESGGDAWETIECIVRQPDFSLIVPLSKKAAPLSVRVDVGAFTAPSPPGKKGTRSESAESAFVWEYGMRAVVSASTSYAICNSDMEAAGAQQSRAGDKQSTYNGLECWATITGTLERTIVAPLVYTGGVTRTTSTASGDVAPETSSAPRWQFGSPDLSDRGRISLSLGPPV